MKPRMHELGDNGCNLCDIRLGTIHVYVLLNLLVVTIRNSIHSELRLLFPPIVEKEPGRLDLVHGHVVVLPMMP